MRFRPAIRLLPTNRFSRAILLPANVDATSVADI